MEYEVTCFRIGAGIRNGWYRGECCRRVSRYGDITGKEDEDKSVEEDDIDEMIVEPLLNKMEAEH